MRCGRFYRKARKFAWTMAQQLSRKDAGVTSGQQAVITHRLAVCNSEPASALHPDVTPCRLPPACADRSVRRSR